MAEFGVKSGHREDAGDVAENGQFLVSIMVRNGASSENDRLSTILPKFRANPGQSICLQNGPFSS